MITPQRSLAPTASTAEADGVSNGIGIGEIVGIVIGGVALSSIIAFGIICRLCHKRTANAPKPTDMSSVAMTQGLIGSAGWYIDT
jgi:hypothetical protein